MLPALAAYRDGIGRVLRAPAVFVGFFAALTLLTAPAAWLVREALRRALGSSLIATDLLSGFDLQWWTEFRTGAEGLASDLAPSVTGFAAVLRNLSGFTGSPEASQASWLIVAFWFLAGTVLSGGILDRYARQRRLGAHGFGSACGRLAGRLLRLNLLVLIAAGGVLWTASRVADPVATWVTRDVTSERTALLWSAALWAGAALVAGAVTIVADCARVRLAVEDRRSALFALVAGFRFARRFSGRLLALYALLAGTTLLIFAVYAFTAPGARVAGPWVWGAFAGSQLYIAARVFAKLLTYAAVTSCFQSALAHADYVAQPAPVWPESPAVETLGPPASDDPGPLP